MRKFLPVMLLSLLAWACNDPSEQDERTQQLITQLEQKLKVERADFNFTEKYDLNLSNQEYLDYLSLIDTGTVTAPQRYLLSKQLKEGQTVDVSFYYYTKTDFANQKTFTAAVSSEKELAIYDDAMKFIFLDALSTYPLNKEEDRQDVKQAVEQGEYELAESLISSVKKKSNDVDDINGRDPDEPGDGTTPCVHYIDEDGNARTNCGGVGGGAPRPPTGIFIAHIDNTVSLYISIQQTNDGGLDIHVGPVGRSFKGAWSDLGSSISKAPSGGHPNRFIFKVIGTFGVEYPYGQGLSSTEFVNLGGFIERRLDGKVDGYGWKRQDSSDKVGVPTIK